MAQEFVIVRRFTQSYSDCVDGEPWGNHAHALTNDGNAATCTPVLPGVGGNSQDLMLFGTPINRLPDDAVIQRLEAIVDCSVSEPGYELVGMAVPVSGYEPEVSPGEHLATSQAETWEHTERARRVFGGVANPWELSAELTPELVNADDFALKIVVGQMLAGSEVEVSVYYADVLIYYTSESQEAGNGDEGDGDEAGYGRGYHPEFHPEKFRELIARKGEPVEWWKAARCPCYSPVSGGHNPQCTLCGGKSMVYSEQNVSAHRVLMQGVSQENQYLQQGVLLAGDVVFTTMPDEIELGEHDLIALKSRRFRHSETVQRGSDKLKWSPVAGVEQIRDMTTVYVEETDYEISQPSPLEPAIVVWKPGRGPEAGATYSVTYHHLPIYIVLPDIGLKRRPIEGVDLPQRVYARIKNPERLA